MSRATKAEISVELVQTTGTRIGATLAGITAPVKVGATCFDTRITGRMNRAIIDLGFGTIQDGQIEVVGAYTPMTGTGVSNARYVQALAGTLTNLTLGTDGQVVTLVGRTGTVLSGPSFLLPNGATSMGLAAGSTITLRKEPAAVVGTGLALAATGDTITLAAHGLPNGRVITLSAIVNAMGVTAGTAYYVVNSTANTFQLSTSLGGAAVDITADGTATVTTSSVWKCIGHQRSTLRATLANASTNNIDDREIWAVGDANVATINTLNGGYEGQRITIVGEHTGANTTTMGVAVHLKLRDGVAFVMGANDTLTLVWNQAASVWREVARSVFTPSAATSTTAALAAIGNAINTTAKATGKSVFNTTTGKPVWAAGATAGSVWVDANGATAHTPV